MKMTLGDPRLTDFGNACEGYIDGIGRIDNNGEVSVIVFHQLQVIDRDARRVITFRLFCKTSELARMARQLADPAAAADDTHEAPPLQLVHH